MVSEDLKNRAETLVSDAHGREIEPYDLITLAADARLKPKRGFLADKPIIEYFDQDEQPHYLIYNEKAGVTIGDSNKKSDVKGHDQNTMWVTDKGIHIAIGRSGGDFHKFIPFDIIKDIEEKSDSMLTLRSHKLIFQTTDGVEVKFVVGPGLDNKEVFSYIDKNITSTPKDVNSTTVLEQNKKKSTQDDKSTSETKLSTLQGMDEYDFEHMISDIWVEKGWTTEVTSESGDRGIDIKAMKDDPFQQLQYIQAKRYSASSKVGSSEVQKYAGLYAREETVDAVIVVTTSGFTSEAKRVAKNRNVKTVNGSQLISMIQEHNIEI